MAENNELENPFSGSGDKFEKIEQARKTLGQLLVEENAITEEQLAESLAEQENTNEKLGEILVKREFVNLIDVSRALAKQLDLPFYEKLPINDIDPRLVKDIPINFCKTHSLMPIARDDFCCTLAVADPLNIFPIDDLRLLLGSNINLVVSPQEVILNSINRVYERSSDTTQSVIRDLEDDVADIDDLVETKDLLDASDDEAPIIRLVHSLLFKAVKERVSDIHIEPYEKEVVVRFRVDGALKDVMSPPKHHHNAIVSRIKIMGKLNIAEKRIPQDGRIQIRAAGKDIDIRLSVLPTIHGERIVMRILADSGLLGLNQIGIPTAMLEDIHRLLGKKHGLILVTGPTGSGKTTCLYSMLSEINTPEKNIMTVEDPVEIQLPGIAQIPVNEKVGLTFAEGLRSILRQDPNVVLIGEIRDGETAHIAIQASLTGHLVFSTLHTNDTASTVARIVDLGIEPYHLTSALLCAMATRLCRRLCKDCRVKYKISKVDIKTHELPEDYLGKVVYRASACEKCNNMGYKGQVGIYELMKIDDKIKQCIIASPDANPIRKTAIESGMLTLREAGLLRVLEGITSFEEVITKTQVDT